jgi:hypothetical protein
MAKAKIATVRIDTEGRRVLWTFSDGTSREIGLDELTQDMRDYAALHGLKQKGSDAYAAAGSESDPVAWAIEQQDSTLKGVREGEWNRGGSVAGLVYEAIAEAMSQPLETILGVFNEMPKEKREAKLKQIRKHPKFKEVYSRMQAERQAKKAQDAPDIADLI